MKFFSKNKENDSYLIEENEINTIYTGKNRPEPSHLLTADEVINFGKQSAERYDGKSALESLKKRMQSISNDAQTALKEEKTVINPEIKSEPKNEILSEIKSEAVTPKEKPAQTKSLLEKCKPFITDDNGKDASVPSAPLYKLESVAEILNNNSQKTIDKLAEKYDITVDYLGKFVEEKAEIEKAEQKPEVQKPTPKIPNDIKIEAIFENVQSSVPVVSEIETELSEDTTDININSATITFTPVSDTDEQKPKILVSSNTQNIDLTGEFAPLENPNPVSGAPSVTLEKDEFEDFTPQDEIRSEADAKKYIRKFSILKRRSFLAVSFSVILTILLAFMKMPFMSGLILGQTKTMLIIFTVISGIVTLLNVDMFASFAKIFKKTSTPDICVSFAALFVLSYAIFGIISGEIILDMLLVLCVLLCFRALGKFRKESYMLSNLRKISASGTKNAIKLIDDNAVTFAIAKNSIDGDTLIAAPQKCHRINDFIKYSTYGLFLNGKLPTITILSLVLSLITGFATMSYYGNILHGLYAAAVIQCFTALPCLFFIKDFPLYAAAKKLNKSGGMIAGQMGASHIEMANALVLNSADIFPSGTVTLHQMKVLSDNSLDETILRAASLTECLGSPLAPIFKKIAGESNITSFPDSDTIKYEERMGISGWVNDKLLFIGNRTLMEAHGIAVPDIEIDRKILRSGYFPVYVAGADKVCALLVVQYSVNPDVVHELRQLSKIGVTILVNNTDPNITSEMICDYLGLYDDSVMIITNAGYHMYKNTTTPKDSCSAPASFKGGALTVAKIINCAGKIRRSNTLLTVLYIVSAILGIMIFAYSSFAGSGTIIGSTTVLLYSLISTVVSYLLYLTQKP